LPAYEREVSSLVKRQPVTLGPDATVEEAAKLMHEEGVSCVVVVEGSKPVGIFTERDLVRVVATGLPLSSKLESVMTKNLVVIKARSTVGEALFLMTKHKIRHLPVVDDEGNLVGVVSIRDVAEAI